MINCKVYKIRKDKIIEWKSWCEKLNTILREEALHTLREEGNFLETFFLFEIDGEYYTIGFGIGEFLPTAKNEKINAIHVQKKKDCFEKAIHTEELYRLELPKKSSVSNIRL